MEVKEAEEGRGCHAGMVRAYISAGEQTRILLRPCQCFHHHCYDTRTQSQRGGDLTLKTMQHEHAAIAATDLRGMMPLSGPSSSPSMV